MRGRRGIVQLLGLLAGAGILVPVLIIVGIALAVLLFGLPAFIGALISPLRTLGIVLVLVGIGWLFFAKDFPTAGIIGAVGLLLLLGSSAGLLSVFSPDISAPDEVLVQDASTILFRGSFRTSATMGGQGDYLQFPLGYGGELEAQMLAACCGRGGPGVRTMRTQYIGGPLDGLTRSDALGLDGRNLWQYEAPRPPAGFVRFFDFSGSGNRCPTRYYYEVNYAPIVPVEAGSIMEYELALSCERPHGIAPAAMPAEQDQAELVQVFQADSLWRRFIGWLRGVFA